MVRTASLYPSARIEMVWGDCEDEKQFGLLIKFGRATGALFDKLTALITGN